jgi:hypothetical protein
MLQVSLIVEKWPAFIAHRRPGSTGENQLHILCHSAQGGESPAV